MNPYFRPPTMKPPASPWGSAPESNACSAMRCVTPSRLEHPDQVSWPRAGWLLTRGRGTRCQPFPPVPVAGFTVAAEHDPAAPHGASRAQQTSPDSRAAVVLDWVHFMRMRCHAGPAIASRGFFGGLPD